MHSSLQAVEIWFLHALFYKLQPEYQFKDIETYSGTPVCQNDMYDLGTNWIYYSQ